MKRPLVVAVIGRGVAYGTLPEIAHALGDRIPVVGLGTWEFSRNGRTDGSILRAQDPAEAVERVLELAQGRAEREGCA